MAECHPVGFQWVMEAKKRGAKIIHIDPRFTRTSAVADQHVPIRAGSDIAFLGGIINYILESEKYFKEYVVNYTNAATIIRNEFKDTDDLDGLFSGYDPVTSQYDTESWGYRGITEVAAAGPKNQGTKVSAESAQAGQGAAQRSRQGSAIHEHELHRDETLKDPNTVFQILKRHYARYTPEMVERVCGVPQKEFLEVCRAVTENSGRDKTTAWVYSVGWTHHSVGVQYIRGAAIIQLLLGNMGRPGGGILALRGHASIQGSTDIPTLFDILPGYLPMPSVDLPKGLRGYIDSMVTTEQKGFWSNTEGYMVSLLKAYWGEKATSENDFCFDYLPKISGDHGTYQTVLDMMDDKVEGYMIMGENPAVGSSNGKLQRMAMAHLKWLVVRDFQLIESATFWKDGPEIATGELKTDEIGTEVFFFPAANHVEKDGSFTQTQRMLQWHHKAIDPPGDCQSELHFFFNLGKKIKSILADSTLERDKPIQDLTWDYPTLDSGEPDAEAVLKEINGTYLTGEKAGQPLDSYTDMKPNGSTSGGCWIYTGVYADNINHAAKRKSGSDQSWVAPDWGWVWPANRRILYNRASADPQGKPWSEKKAYVWWDSKAKKWTGHDVPDFELTKAPTYKAPKGSRGPEALSGNDPFIMQSDGKGWLFVPAGLKDGPLPAHYEPQESPVSNAVYPQQANPTRQVYKRDDNLSNPSGHDKGSEVFPYVFTTYRLTEHHTAGGMSRFLPYLSELQPEFFCEVSPELAEERGLRPNGWATIITARTAIEARVLITERIKPLKVGGKVIHQIGLPYHWGVGGEALVSGDSANDLLGLTLDPNVHIQEAKASSCDIQPGRRPVGTALLKLVEQYRQRAGITVNTSNQLLSPKKGES
jgi:formate dehydrogenase major subunit